MRLHSAGLSLQAQDAGQGYVGEHWVQDCAAVVAGESRDSIETERYSDCWAGHEAGGMAEAEERESGQPG